MKTCLRCDWEGVTGDAACPDCGTRLYVAAAPVVARPSARSSSGLSSGLSSGPSSGLSSGPSSRSSSGHSSRPAPPPPAPTRADPTASLEGEERPRRTAAVALLLAGLVAVLAAALTGPSEEPEVVAPPPRSSGEAIRTANAFLAAYGDLDADRAIGHLADDAEISLLIRSVGATGVEGTHEEFRLYLSMLEAWRYHQRVGPCEERGVTTDGTLVRCDFSYDFLGSDRLGLGPYDGSAFDLTIRGDRVAQILKVWSFDRFSREMWEPFATWVVEAHPRDAGRMYSDPTRRGVRLDEGSVRRWSRHTRTYIRVRLAELDVADA